MARRKPTTPTQQFATQVAKAHEDGYMFLPMRSDLVEAVTTSASAPGWQDILNTSLHGANKSLHQKPDATLFASSGNETPVDDCGSPQLGYISWGANNRIPNTVSLLASMLPYTATGVKFNTDIAAGLGPSPKYRYAQFVNGTVSVNEVDYEAAGTLIQGQIVELKTRLYKLTVDATQQEGQSANSSSLLADLTMTLTAQIDKLQQRYNTWQETNRQLTEFLEANNLPLVAYKLFNEMSLFGICFPELQLSQNPGDKVWIPKVTGISARSALTTRLERMDDTGRINHVYLSNQWLDPTTAPTSPEDTKIAALPALDPEHPFPTLSKAVRNTRDQKIEASQRPTRFILPSFEPTAGRPYYPQPAWWSLFGGDIYAYASSIITDRITRQRNATSFGRIIYIHTGYLEKLQHQMGADTEAKKQAVLTHCVAEINTFLSDANNAGKHLLSLTFIGNDGKEHDAYRVVDIPKAAKGAATDDKTTLEEISSIVLFSMGIHSDLIGNAPGKSGSSGGTYQREMYQMKQAMMSYVRATVLKILEVATQFNEWDKNLTWHIKQITLTTLDRNKSGMEESTL